MKLSISGQGEALVSNPIDALVAEYGAWRVLLRAARALIAPRRAAVEVPLNLSQLNDHLLRDLGIQPGPRTHRHWSDFR